MHLVNTNYYKIGVTDSIDLRLKDLQTANPYELKILYSKQFVYFFIIETYLHNFFIKKNVRGEWFELQIEDVYETMYFLKRLENTNNISGEIRKRLVLQKKHKEKLKSAQKNGIIRNQKQLNKYTGYTEPKISMNKKNGDLRVYFRAKNPETNTKKMFVFKAGINREKNLEVRGVKAEKLKEKILRLLEAGLNPFFNKEDFKKL